MSKVLLFACLFIFSLFIYASLLISKVNAQNLPSCLGIRHDPSELFSSPQTTPQAKFIVNVGKNDAYPSWKIQFECGVPQNVEMANSEPGGTEISREIKNTGCEFHTGNHTLKVMAVVNGQDVPQCIASYKVTASRTQCQLDIDPKTGITSATKLKVSGSNLIEGDRYALFIDADERITGDAIAPGLVKTPAFSGPDAIEVPNRLLTPGIHKLSVRIWRGPSLPVPGVTAPGHNYGPPLCPLEFIVGTAVSPGGISRGAQPGGIFRPTSALGEQCGTDADPAIKTAIGCIHTSPVGFINDSLKFILGIAGGLAFLMMLLGAFQMLTSAGNPETLNAGKDRLTSAVIGLLFVIFSVLLLQIIGVDILGLPEFER